MPSDDFIPKTRLTKDGSPIGRGYWGLPATTVPKDAASGKTAPQLLGELLEQNIKLLDEALNTYARGQILSAEISEGRRVTAHCCVQAIQTLRDVRELLLALVPAG